MNRSVRLVSNGRFSLGGDTPGSGVAGTPVGLTPSDRKGPSLAVLRILATAPLAKTASGDTPTGVVFWVGVPGGVPPGVPPGEGGVPPGDPPRGPPPPPPPPRGGGGSPPF